MTFVIIGFVIFLKRCTQKETKEPHTFKIADPQAEK